MSATRDEKLVTQWRALLTSYNGVAAALDHALQDSHGIGLSEFEILDRLVEAKADKCRMQSLAAEMYLSQSALSRAVARLEREGLVARAMCDDDRRALFVEPTETGRQRHDEARATHRTVLAEHLA